MLPGDRLVCAFVKPQKVDVEFKEWPLHVTVVPWVRLNEPSKQIAEGLQRALITIKPFHAKAGDEVTMGPKERRARLLELPTPFTGIEQKVRNYFHKKRAWLVDETTKRRYEFRPHVTVQQTKELAEDKTFRVGKLYIVEQKGDYKQVMAEISLG